MSEEKGKAKHEISGIIVSDPKKIMEKDLLVSGKISPSTHIGRNAVSP